MGRSSPNFQTATVSHGLTQNLPNSLGDHLHAPVSRNGQKQALVSIKVDEWGCFFAINLKPISDHRFIVIGTPSAQQPFDQHSVIQVEQNNSFDRLLKLTMPRSTPRCRVRRIAKLSS